MQNLSGKIALITGGNSGIGLATARLFKQRGATVVITGRDANSLEKAAAELGDDTLALQSDAGDLAQIDALMAEIQQRFGRLDVLFANAAVAKPMPFGLVDEDNFDLHTSINLKGVFFTIQKALPLMTGGGTIVVTTSITNQMGAPNFSVYAATKAGLRSLVQSLGLELIERGVRINAISPGPIRTPMFDRFGWPDVAVQTAQTTIQQRSPSKRFGEPEEIAKAALFLASDDSSYMVGEELVIDGGRCLL